MATGLVESVCVPQYYHNTILPTYPNLVMSTFYIVMSTFTHTFDYACSYQNILQHVYLFFSLLRLIIRVMDNISNLTVNEKHVYLFRISNNYGLMEEENILRHI